MSNLIILLFCFPSTKSVIFANFTLLVIVRGLRSYNNGVWSLIDTVVMKLVADKKDFGKHRLFASLAWGLGSVIAGKLVDLYGMNMMFVMCSIWGIITCFLIVFGMPNNIRSRKNTPKHRSVRDSLVGGVIGEDITNGGTAVGTAGSLEVDTSHDEKDKLSDDDAVLVVSTPKHETVDLHRTFKLLMSLRRDRQLMLSLGLMFVYWNAMFIVDRILYIQMEQELGATKFMNGIATLCMLTVIIHY